MLGSLKMKDNKRLGPWQDVPKSACTRNSKIYEYVLSIESDMVSFPRCIPHTSAVLLGSTLIFKFCNTKF